MGQGVDAEGGLLDEADAQNAGVDETTQPVVEHEATEDGGEDEAHEDDALEVVAVLPDNDAVLVEVANVAAADALGVLLEQHPAHVRVQETLADGVGVLVGVCVSVVRAVAS